MKRHKRNGEHAEARKAVQDAQKSLERATESRKETRELVGRLKVDNEDAFAELMSRLFRGEVPGDDDDNG